MFTALFRQIIALAFAAALFGQSTTLQAQTLSTASVAERAIRAWETGESTGNYSDFQALLSPQFELFSHPVQPARGVHRAAQAREMMTKLIAQRTEAPNALKFSNLRQYQTQNHFLFEFDSEGKVAGYPYKGWNAIQISIGSDNKIVSFREYLGDVEPAWFQKR